MALRTVTSSIGFQQITGLSSAKSLNLATVNQGAATYALVQAEGQSVRWRDDGTAPTASVGMLLGAGETLSYDGDLSKIQFIQVASSASLNVSLYN